MVPRRSAVVAVAAVLGLPRVGHADDGDRGLLADAECDPLPFATGRYGCQIGLRPDAFGGIRISIAQFSVDVPDFIAEIGRNDGFHLDVRPGSGALYVLYYFAAPGDDGFTVGGSLRYLRLRYTHDDAPGERAAVSELSPEAIVGYQWHPFDNGFYLQPWLALGVTLARSGDAVVGGHQYDELPVTPFFTVNVGWEQRLWRAGRAPPRRCSRSRRSRRRRPRAPPGRRRWRRATRRRRARCGSGPSSRRGR